MVSVIAVDVIALIVMSRNKGELQRHWAKRLKLNTKEQLKRYMDKTFKVEAIYDDKGVWYAVYQKRFLWGWKYLGKYVFESEARKIAEELTKTPTYFKTK